MNNTTAPIPHSPAEADFFRSWQAATDSTHGDPAALALAGGRIADRLAWVFMSGYQAALRRCFPEFVGAGWCCFAVAEPDDGPGCTLEGDADGFRLSGCKSWIAGARTVERLVVSVGSDTGRRFALIPRSAAGVSITLPRESSFLRELSQGAARFDAVHVPGRDVLADPARARLFRSAEPLYVLLALNACLRAVASNAGNTALSHLAADAIELGRSLCGHLDDRSRIAPGFAAFKAATTEVVGAASNVRSVFPDSLRDSWATDAKLLAMFGVHDPS